MTREEKIAELKRRDALGTNVTPSSGMTREQKIAELKRRDANTQAPSTIGDQNSLQNDSLAALQGAGESLTLGYLPEMQARAEKAMESVYNALPGQKIPEQSYDENLKQYENRQSSLQKESPLAYGTGSIAGAVALPVPGTGAIKGATAIGRLAKGAIQGAAIGGGLSALQKQDESVPDISEDPIENLKARALSGLSGGAMGGVFGGASQGISNIIDKAAPKLKNYLAGKQMGLTGQTAKAEKLIKQKKMDKLSDFMDEHGMLDLGSTTPDVLNKTEKILKTSGEEIGDTYKKIEASVPMGGFTMETATPQQIKELLENSIDPRIISQDILKKSKELFDIGEIDQAAMSALESELSRFQKHGSNISEVLRYRKGLDDRLNKIYQKRGVVDLTDKEEALTLMRRQIKNKLDAHINSIDNILNTKETQNLKKLNDTYSKASDIKNVSEKYVIKGQSKNLLGLPEVIAASAAGGAGLVTGNAPEGAAGGLLTGAGVGLARRYSPALSYKLLKAAQKTSSPYLATKVMSSPWIKMNKDEENK